MSCVSLLRRIGLLPPKQATSDEVINAQTENAQRDNEKAFSEMHEAYTKVPEANNRLRETIKRSATPFAELEQMMQGAGLRQRKNH